jgi:hypothetical protein
MLHASPRLTNDSYISLQDDSPGVAPMTAPLSAHRVPLGFPPLAVAGGPTASGQFDCVRNRGWRSYHEPRRSHRSRNRGRRSDYEPRRLDCPSYRARQSDRHPRPSDCQDLRRSFIACFMRAISTASTSVVAAGEGRTSGTSSQFSSNDHTGEAGLSASDRQTHPVGHLGANLVVGTLLHLHRPRRSKLASCHGRRVCCLDRQQHMGSYPSSCWFQHYHRQVDFQAQVQF